MPVIPLDDLGDPRLNVYRDLKYQVTRRERHWFVVEGLNLVERMLNSPLAVLSVLTEPDLVDHLGPRVGAATPIFVVPHAWIEELAGFRFHRGVLACGARPENPDLSAIIGSVDRPVVIPICVGVQDPENVGGIIRSSAALGARAVILGPECSDPFSRRVARTSMGAIFRLPLRRAPDPDLAGDLRRLQIEFGFQLVATVLDPGAEPLDRFAPAARTALLLGNEGCGLAAEWIERCDRRVTIPMQEGADSLNVNVAAGILLHQMLR
jgi:tRNA G18 (ribose-2'-O)-methylase SpoU